MMLRTRLLLCLSALLFLQAQLFSQIPGVTIYVQQPPQNIYRMADVWKGEIVNQTPNSYRVYLHAVVTERKTGRLVVDARSAQLDVPPGLTVINGSQIEPFTVDAYNRDYYEMILQSGSIPTGDYWACVDAIEVGTEQKIAVSCQDVTVNSTSQPFLIAPTDASAMSDRYPVFTWMSTTPPIKRESMLYRLRVYEIFGTQTPQDAALRNPAFLDVAELRQTVYMYPTSARAFVPGQRYAWVVGAYERVPTGFQYLGESEVWSFIANEPLSIGASDSASLVQPSLPNIVANQAGASFMLAGNYRIIGQSASRQGSFQAKPADFARAEVNPTLVFFGIPLSASVLYSTEQQSNRQEINAYSLTLDPDALRRIVERRAMIALDQFMASDSGASLRISNVDSASVESDSTASQTLSSYRKLYEYRTSFGSSIMDYTEDLQHLGLLSTMENAMLWMPRIGIGTIFPSLTPLTLNGSRVQGASIEWNPASAFYISAVQGRTLQPLIRTDVVRNDTAVFTNLDNADYGQTLTGARIGFGAKDGEHWTFSGVYTTDDKNSISNPDSTSLSTPKRNIVGSMDLRIEPFKGIWFLTAEFAGSVTVGDLNAPKFSTDRLPPILLDLIDSSTSAYGDWSGAAHTTVDLASSGTRFSGNVRRIGLGYRALGVPYMRVDVFRYDASLDQSLFDHQLTLGVFARRDQDNLIPLKRATTVTTSIGASMGLAIRNLPYLRFSYMPYVQESNSTDTLYTYSNRTNLMSITGGHSYRIADLNASTQFTFSRQQSSTTFSQSDYSVTSISGQQTVTFKMPLTASLGVGLIMQDAAGSTDAAIVTGDGSVSYAFNNILSANGSVVMALDKTYGDRFGYGVGIMARFDGIADVSLRADRTIFGELLVPSVRGGSYNENVARVIISKSW